MQNPYLKECLVLTLIEEYRWRMFENWMLKRIFGPKREEVTGSWRQLYSMELVI
jgi:hypothetical protein